MIYVVLQLGLIAALLLGTPPTALSTAAWAVVFAAAGLVCWAVLSMRAPTLRVGPDPAADGRLVTRGAYAWFRHPMYTATIIGMAALVWAVPSTVRVLLWYGLCAVLWAKARHEERLLAARYPAYAAYCDRTARFSPVPARWVPAWRRLCGLTLRALAVGTLLWVSLALVPVHRPVADWLACANEPAAEGPDWIVVLGGGEMPSGSTLLRCHAGAELARQHPDAGVVVAMPAMHDPEAGSVARMRDELVLRGVARERIRMETRGHNTWQQARNTADLLGPAATGRPVAVVTSGLHMRRAVLCFRAAGFAHAAPGFASRAPVGDDLGHGVHWRYAVWSNLAGQVHLARELLALTVYRLRGKV